MAGVPLSLPHHFDVGPDLGGDRSPCSGCGLGSGRGWWGQLGAYPAWISCGARRSDPQLRGGSWVRAYSTSHLQASHRHAPPPPTQSRSIQQFGLLEGGQVSKADVS